MTENVHDRPYIAPVVYVDAGECAPVRFGARDRGRATSAEVLCRRLGQVLAKSTAGRRRSTRHLPSATVAMQGQSTTSVDADSDTIPRSAALNGVQLGLPKAPREWDYSESPQTI